MVKLNNVEDLEKIINVNCNDSNKFLHFGYITKSKVLDRMVKKNSRFYGIYDNGILVSFVNFRIDKLEKGTIDIDYICSSKKGFGSKLINELKKKYSKIYLLSLKKLVDYYKSHGFNKYVYDDNMNDDNILDMVWEKK